MDVLKRVQVEHPLSKMLGTPEYFRFGIFSNFGILAYAK
jgi:hypothetical protein